MAPAIRKLAVITAAAGASDALRGALVELEQETRREPGCGEFSFFQALSAPGTFMLIEQFDDAHALAQHLQLPHTKAFFAKGLVASVVVEDLPVD
ncbi:putative quinol monooxygenase [Massilia endophytica]|uniref:putative quinol monooxygenase n=1 Tax=Massilia endophytica TaxID=2899220 RepID=UPI001E3274EA|nr:putative quinol monooxygenase [Massilia endophytica]UGQ47422.1 antibiotic biosynthesis monooxygenase [Massilia endophytica]